MLHWIFLLIKAKQVIQDKYCHLLVEVDNLSNEGVLYKI